MYHFPPQFLFPISIMVLICVAFTLFTFVAKANGFKNKILDKFKPQEPSPVRIFLLLDGRVKNLSWGVWDSIKYMAQAYSEQEAIDKGLKFHETSPTLDAVWVEHELVGSRFVPKLLRNDLPPVYKMSID